MAPRQQLIDGAVDGRAGNGKRAATRSENRHPDDVSLRIDQGAAFGCWAQGEVKANEAIDRAATQHYAKAPPARATMPSAASGPALVISDRQNHVPGRGARLRRRYGRPSG